MKNIELLNICYKYFNRVITSDVLVEMLTNMDKTNLSKKETKEIDNMVNEIKDIIKNTTDKEDEFITNKKEKIHKMIEMFEKVEDDSPLKEKVDKNLEGLKKEYNSPMDNQERWLSITKYIIKNEYFSECFGNLSDYELLEFIAQYICASFPPKIDQEEFNKLVKVGIEHDEREWLWRLAFNYEKTDLNLNEIMDYYIKIKDGYYISELISAVGDSIDIDRAIDKINDKELIEDLIKRKEVIKMHVTENHLKKLLDKIK